MRTGYRKAIPALGLLCWAAATPAQAHPHVWVEMQSDVVFNDRGLISAVNVSWTFDDAYAQLALDGLDKNGDGVYDPSELEPLTRENLDSLKDYNFFTYVRFDGALEVKPVPSDAEIEQTRAMLATKGPDWKPAEDEDFGAIFAQPVTIQCKA